MKQEKHIVITRPAHQAGPLAAKVEAAGGQVYLFPTLEITGVTLTAEETASLQQLDRYDIIIFISANAVEFGLEKILADSSIAGHTRLATIGQASARALQQKLGKPADITPGSNFNSEGLLATAAMQDVKDKHILVVRGKGGRELLRDTLRQRGAKVDYLDVYQRRKPATPATELEQYLQNNQIAAIVITSAESLKNLLEMTAEQSHPALYQARLILINQRLVEIAKDAGFHGQLIVATESIDDAIVDALIKHNVL